MADGSILNRDEPAIQLWVGCRTHAAPGETVTKFRGGVVRHSGFSGGIELLLQKSLMKKVKGVIFFEGKRLSGLIEFRPQGNETHQVKLIIAKANIHRERFAVYNHWFEGVAGPKLILVP